MNQCAPLNLELPAWQRSSDEELVNAVTHAFGFAVAVLGALMMTGGMFARGEAWLTAGCGVYLASLVAVYLMSTLSHTATSPKWKTLFRQLDQACIYLLIVATYTPFSLAYLPGAKWSALLAAMWIVALVGFASKVFFAHRVYAVSVVSYVLLGWMPIVAIPEMWRAAPHAVLGSVFAGGACYMVGMLFLINDERVRHFHATWHLLVIAGSACHFFGIWMFVVDGRI